MANDSEWITGQVKISIGGVPVEMEMTVPAKPVKPQRMLPVFQKISNSFVIILSRADGFIYADFSFKNLLLRR